MTRWAYLTALLLSWAGVLLADRRLRLRVAGPRLVRTLAVTVPVFLVFDLVGAARGWFTSSPGRNVVIVPPGVPLEEPVLLGFLCLLSVVIWRLCGRFAR